MFVSDNESQNKGDRSDNHKCDQQLIQFSPSFRGLAELVLLHQCRKDDKDEKQTHTTHGGGSHPPPHLPNTDVV
jgi:hypothetical protein